MVFAFWRKGLLCRTIGGKKTGFKIAFLQISLTKQSANFTSTFNLSLIINKSACFLYIYVFVVYIFKIQWILIFSVCTEVIFHG